MVGDIITVTLVLMIITIIVNYILDSLSQFALQIQRAQLQLL